MATARFARRRLPSSAAVLLLLLLFLAAAPPPAHSLPYSQYKTLFFFSSLFPPHLLGLVLPYSQYEALFSLATRVASLLAARGDLAGAERARAIAELSELLGLVEDLARAESNAERASWIVRNYENAVWVSKSVFARLLRVFSKSGPPREMVETLRKEVVDGDFLRDCLELGSNDLKGLVQILKDLASQYYSSSDHHQDL
ncbi:hypothetical protein ACJRO7_021094 [Eucalyptus globulus]|uniref:Uncharacterized protein n=1 Tax=Eucalyptus globulus TaxID=34317 RepID=A0ABD3KLB8_EUCGL